MLVLLRLEWKAFLCARHVFPCGMKRIESSPDMVQILSQKPATYLITAFLIGLVAYTMQGGRNPDKLLRLNPTGPFERTTRRVQAEFMPRGQAMMTQARQTYGKQPCRLCSHVGDVIVFPDGTIHEIRNNPKICHSRYPTGKRFCHSKGGQDCDGHYPTCGALTTMTTRRSSILATSSGDARRAKKTSRILLAPATSIWALGMASMPVLGVFTLPTSSRSRSATWS